ncbi:DeoR/GlpR transcriptional regulator [Carbonactinospora thermoautotrophica]|uniref:Lactose phosphotransferase system repressor n=1 Tax=Carbonactinospora thermoautotrophica TaxID=1469144 RepID=A0A132MRE7_9ACTN|nr:DeoR/GlpR family DNA-binding transcription regulator [Carbonactinospora thermoautotrophica]KWW97272.1 Transcriptional regulator [Carbonactinospora thermoautotrophica]KWX00448.1 DeoR family transcriptional regulator [Carbonactinospora thermoautotrophica]KWX08423.1 DeoR family transcriptional regulator [Carbonactinospora thermoautotrophica]MCX9193824.1 DeoR/GlpR transcriptional regulator [Carbonactinospora thermoautotrophica]
MHASARQREILHRLLVDGYVEAKELAASLGVDTSTIRRDLDALARTGQVQRTHGGARPVLGRAVDVPYATKKSERVKEKVAIAVAAASRVRNGDTVILDSGSTTYEVAVALRHKKRLTVITNDLRIGKFVATLPDVRLLVTGGELLGSVFTLVGERAVSFVEDYNADWTFLGADAIDPVAGITNTNTLEVPLKRAMIAAGDTTVVVVDSSKFGQRALAKVATLDEVDLILTDAELPEDAAQAYGDHVVRAPITTPSPGEETTAEAK